VPSPIIARADALMHRKRQSNIEYDDIPVLTDTIDEDDDIPILTDIATEAEPQQPAVSEHAETLVEPVANEQHDVPLMCAPIDSAQREQLVNELDCRGEERLKAALPQIIHSTIRDFLAEQEMIANN